MKYKLNLKVIIKLMVFGFVIISVLVYASAIKKTITDCAKMWALVLMPSLFPYLVFTKYISSSNIIGVFSLPQRIISSMFGISRASSVIYLCSLFSGYPTGAICATQAHKNGEITLEETERLICFTNNPSPVFLISAVGGCMLGSVKDGIAIYVIQTLSAALWAMGSKKASCACTQVASQARITSVLANEIQSNFLYNKKAGCACTQVASQARITSVLANEIQSNFLYNKKKNFSFQRHKKNRYTQNRFFYRMRIGCNRCYFKNRRICYYFGRNRRNYTALAQ